MYWGTLFTGCTDRRRRDLRIPGGPTSRRPAPLIACLAAGQGSAHLTTVGTPCAGQVAQSTPRATRQVSRCIQFREEVFDKSCLPMPARGHASTDRDRRREGPPPEAKVECGQFACDTTVGGRVCEGRT